MSILIERNKENTCVWWFLVIIKSEHLLDRGAVFIPAGVDGGMKIVKIPVTARSLNHNRFN